MAAMARRIPVEEQERKESRDNLQGINWNDDLRRCRVWGLLNIHFLLQF